MSIKQFIRTALGLTLVASISVQAVAFMNTIEQGETAATKFDYVQLVDSITEDLKSEEVDCGGMLTKIDEALDKIDESLDVGVIDEESLLIARDTLVSMRLELPCRPDRLSQAETLISEIAPTNIVSDVLIGEQVIGGGIGDCCGGGAVGAAGGGGGGGVAGGSGLRRLLLLGGLTGGIVAVSTSGDDNPPPETSL